MPKRSSKGDLNTTAFSVVRQAVGQDDPATIAQSLDNAELRRQLMKEMGRRGGKKGGKARARNLTAEQRSDIAKRAAAKRWAQKPKR